MAGRVRRQVPLGGCQKLVIGLNGSATEVLGGSGHAKRLQLVAQVS
jgi:hypothetical protein